jgi:hypothetical protein
MPLNFWGTSEQRDWLTSHYTAFKRAQKAATINAFFTNLTDEFFAQFGIPTATERQIVEVKFDSSIPNAKEIELDAMVKRERRTVSDTCYP